MKGGLLSVILSIVVAVAMVPAAAQAQYRGDGYSRAAAGYEGDPGRPADRDQGDRRADYRRDDQSRGDERHRCRNDGSGGTIIGAIAGGLLGNAVAGYRDRAAGTLLGGVGGALAGRAIDRNC